MYSLKDILFESLKNYKYFRPYKHDEIEEEIDEYFRNDYTQSKLPKIYLLAFKDRFLVVQTRINDFPGAGALHPTRGHHAGVLSTYDIKIVEINMPSDFLDDIRGVHDA